MLPWTTGQPWTSGRLCEICLRDRKQGCLATISNLLLGQGCSHSSPPPELNLLTLVPQHQRGSHSRTPLIPKSADAQVPYLKWWSTVSPPYPWMQNPQIQPTLEPTVGESADVGTCGYVRRADCTSQLLLC